MKRSVIYSIAFGFLGVCAALVTCALPARPRNDVENGITEGVTRKPSATRPADVPDKHLPVRPMPPEYRILLKRSMFARQGSIPAVRKEVVPVEAVRSVLQDYALRGVASQDGMYVAFVEYATKNSILRLHTGDEVARGHVSDISPTGIDYEAAPGQVTHVAIGSRFDGTRPEPSADAPEGAENKPSKKKNPTGSGNTPAGEPPSGDSREKAK